MAALTVLVVIAGYFAIGLFASVLILAVKIHLDDRKRIRPFDWDIDREFAALLRDRAKANR